MPAYWSRYNNRPLRDCLSSGQRSCWDQSPEARLTILNVYEPIPTVGPYGEMINASLED